MLSPLDLEGTYASRCQAWPCKLISLRLPASRLKYLPVMTKCPSLAWPQHLWETCPAHFPKEIQGWV